MIDFLIVDMLSEDSHWRINENKDGKCEVVFTEKMVVGIDHKMLYHRLWNKQKHCGCMSYTR